MEAILKRRNPNSLPSLMIAAAAAGETSNPGNNRTAYTEVLESRVNKLEKELEGKDSETETLIRGVEQKYRSIKVCFIDQCMFYESRYVLWIKVWFMNQGISFETMYVLWIKVCFMNQCMFYDSMYVLWINVCFMNQCMFYESMYVL